MLNKLIIFLALLFIKSTISIKPRELCLLIEEATNEECLEKDKPICDSVCPTRYKYKCIHNTCAISQEVCKKYESISIILSSRNKIVTSEFLQKYELFQQKLKNCPLSVWKPSMVCVNADNICYGKKVLRSRGSFIKVMQRIGCECTGKQYKYKCDDADYCGVNKEACDDFNSAEADLIKKCDV